MSIFLISLDKKITETLEEGLRANTSHDIHSFSPSFPEIKMSGVIPNLIIIVSEKNETWSWWIIGELLFQFPDAFYIILHAEDRLKDGKKLSEKIVSYFAAPDQFYSLVEPHVKSCGLHNGASQPA